MWAGEIPHSHHRHPFSESYSDPAASVDFSLSVFPVPDHSGHIPRPDLLGRKCLQRGCVHQYQQPHSKGQWDVQLCCEEPSRRVPQYPPNRAHGHRKGVRHHAVFCGPSLHPRLRPLSSGGHSAAGANGEEGNRGAEEEQVWL